MSKYGARKTEVDNIRFDSRSEAMYYQQLKLRKRAKEIADFSLQPEFSLLDKYRDSKGKMQRGITYRADFRVIHLDGTEEIVDIKGFRTEAYKIKAKIFAARYPQYIFTEVQV